MATLGSWLLIWLAGSLAFAGDPAAAPPAQPAAVDAEMVRWAAARVPAGLPAERRLALLHQALVGRRGLGMGTAERTGTARQAFAERRANCVAFAHLYLGLARRLGLPVYFLLARGISGEDRKAGLRVLEGHLAVGFGGPGRGLVVDAEGVRPAGLHHFERIADAVAEAIFWSNRGVEALLDGAGAPAVTWLERASRGAPGLATVWRNLGVARKRAGDLAGAARAAAEARRLEAGPPRAGQLAAAL